MNRQGLHVSHTNGAAQIAAGYGAWSVAAIVVIVLAMSVATARRRRPATGQDLLDQDSGAQLRGAAVLLLLVGHLCMKVIDGYQPLERAGEWAVVIFLLVSGVALAKTYGSGPIDGRRFLRQRVQRIVPALWITLSLFFLLDYLLLGRTYAVVKRMVLPFAGVIMPVPPNGPAWFMSYIFFLYAAYFLAARLPVPRASKVGLLFAATTGTALLFHAVPWAEERFGIWSQYAPVFPFAVAFGLYRERFLAWRSGPRTARGVALSVVVLAGTLFYLSGMAKGELRETHFGSLGGLLLDNLGSLSFAAAVASLIPRIDAARQTSALLAFFGTYSFEVYLVHFPFMEYYDFLLFRRPLVPFFFVYLAGVVVLAIGLQRLTRRVNALLAGPSPRIRAD